MPDSFLTSLMSKGNKSAIWSPGGVATRENTCHQRIRCPAMPLFASVQGHRCSPITAIQSSQSCATTSANTTLSFLAATPNVFLTILAFIIIAVVCTTSNMPGTCWGSFRHTWRAGVERVHAQPRNFRRPGSDRSCAASCRLNDHTARGNGCSDSTFGVPAGSHSQQCIQPHADEAGCARRMKSLVAQPLLAVWFCMPSIAP